ncbi:hypothetical protein OG2516_05203 [Oceanicola granulosus HTCC2516]|uniref:DUF2484 family protein n=1 Tax=Oceanicola granulosus (strain ATCC BAA-861 / DSM 15982 / KCTC 12143 / HTCC2516) TaxID=314256 RepID=Q2CIW1_OCEGH|nr:DUF2484 family protein [Oceanicola granulosus]EAR52478.1 hypothetical protein OG2516_05203 [Oceanicola granulosus HTCC2516]
MSLALTAAFAWIVTANLLALIPSRDNHWRRAYGLIATGLPLLGWVIWSDGAWWGLACLAAGASILRWPVYFLGRWLRSRLAA